MKTMTNLDKEVEERRFYHNIHNTDTNECCHNNNRQILLADWHDHVEGMDDGCSLVLWNT
jgi:hypothetical protein